MRLSIFIAKTYNISRRQAKDAVKNGLVTIEKSIITKDIDVNGNENIIYNISNKSISYEINDYLLYKDKEYMFLYKPSFMHSDRHSITDELTISDIYSDFPDYKPLSRLDYEADGVVGAINKHINLKNISKSYYAIVSGDFNKKITMSNKIDADNRKKVKVLEDTSGFLTNIKKAAYNGKFSLVEVTLEKAARHQVRAFLSHLKYPILGDNIYGGNDFKRLCLHCFSYTINGKTILCKKQTENFINLYKSLD